MAAEQVSNGDGLGSPLSAYSASQAAAAQASAGRSSFAKLGAAKAADSRPGAAGSPVPATSATMAGRGSGTP